MCKNLILLPAQIYLPICEDLSCQLAFQLGRVLVGVLDSPAPASDKAHGTSTENDSDLQDLTRRCVARQTLHAVALHKVALHDMT